MGDRSGEGAATQSDWAPSQVEPAGEESAQERSEEIHAAAEEQSQRAAPRPGGESSIEWIMVAWRGLRASARLLLQTRWTCLSCGRTGKVVEVVGLDEWRRRRTSRGGG